MQKDLFGKKVTSKKRTRLEIMLTSYDKKSFNDRLERLGYLKKIFPKGFGFVSDLETSFILDEVKTTFIDGAFYQQYSFLRHLLRESFKDIIIVWGFTALPQKD